MMKCKDNPYKEIFPINARLLRKNEETKKRKISKKKNKRNLKLYLYLKYVVPSINLKLS